MGMAAPSPVLSLPPEMLELSLEARKEQWIDALQRCENIHHVEKILDTNGKYSYGPWMFQMQTWLGYGKPFGATPDNIGSTTLQRTVVRSMLDDGGWTHWYICGKRVTAKLGEYPQ